MPDRLGRLLGSSLAIALIALGAPAIAGAATTHKSHHARNTHSTLTRANNSGSSTGGGNGETALTGSTLSSASAAALAAVPGGTVDSATTETDGTGAYEVIVTKSDGSRVKVVEDSSFAVLSTSATHCG